MNIEQHLKYDPETGYLYRDGKQCSSNPDASTGYLEVMVLQKSFYQHRVAWFLSYGEWPDRIDHINGCKTDNRLCNLRNASAAVNARNAKARVDNTSGYSGVYPTKSGKWRVFIAKKHYGTHKEFGDACRVADEVRRTNGYTARHGK